VASHRAPPNLPRRPSHELKIARAAADIVEVRRHHDAATAFIQLGQDVLDGLLFSDGVKLNTGQINDGKLAGAGGIGPPDDGASGETPAWPVRQSKSGVFQDGSP